MITEELVKKEYYQALVTRDSLYDGIFFAGIKTTGIFCHATCPARKPKYENCEFFVEAEEALLAGYRPCKRCEPLSYPQEIPTIVKQLVALVEATPEKRWTDKDFSELGIHSSAARRQFKTVYGMTFVQYARARRMGIAMDNIRKGQNVLSSQLDIGYDSTSGFHDAFAKIMDTTPKHSKDVLVLYANWFNTKIGPMMCVTDETYLYLLEFVDRRGLEREIERLKKRLNAIIIPRETKITTMIQQELEAYFSGENLVFKTPLYELGSDFQKEVWQKLKEIPIGETTSYKEIGVSMNREKAYRAVARANGSNQLAIVIPCHRVIQSNGELGGYGGGLVRKQWLLDHEKKYGK